MNSFAADHLDQAVTAMIADGMRAGTPGHARDRQVGELLEVAGELPYLPRPEFRARLRAELEEQAALPADRRRSFDASLRNWNRERLKHPPREVAVPPLFIIGSRSFPMRGSHLAVSFALHVAALALVAASGWWMVENRAVVRSTVAELIPSDTYMLSPSETATHGGGGGGDRDKVQASHGSAPRFTSEQLAPPAVIVRNEGRKLPVESTAIGPPDVKLPQTSQVGDPMSAILNPPSNGTGSGSGIGSGEGGGVGPGHGPGVGPGIGGGVGGGIYHVGGSVSTPRAVFDPEPEYSEEARKAKFQGSVILSAIIGSDGRPRDLRVAWSLGMGLDEKAMEAVNKWRFAP